jgi:hypothetical protein
VFVISGSLQHDRRFETAAREDLRDYEGKVSITYLTDLLPPELAIENKERAAAVSHPLRMAAGK